MRNPAVSCPRTPNCDAGGDAGYPSTDDYNGHRQEGFGPMHMTVRGGVRESTSRAYLDPVRKRSSLTVMTQVLVDKIQFDGKRAVAISAQHRSNNVVFQARKEIILSSGAIASPMILQRSGIGHEDDLRAAGIEPFHALAGVGRNLQDHLEVYFQFHCKQPVSLNSKLGLLSKFLIGARWFFFRDGLGATNHFESCAFIRSQAGRKSPDIQYHFLPAAMRYDGAPSINGHGFQVHVGPNKPASRGHVAVTSSDPSANPSILFNYLQHPEDIAAWRRCIRLTREIMIQPALDPYRGEEIQPGPAVQTDDEIDRWVRANVESAYHPCGTCRMGSPTDSNTVVDPHGRVLGLDGLRIVDASIFPTVTNGNINAPTIMVAERIADHILGQPPLPPSAAPVWLSDDWPNSQRERPPVREMSALNEDDETAQP